MNEISKQRGGMMKNISLTMLFSALISISTADETVRSFTPAPDWIITAVPSDSFAVDQNFFYHLSVHHNGKTIFRDSSDTEYYLTEKKKPTLRTLANGDIELLMLISNRPGKDIVRDLHIRNTAIVRDGIIGSTMTQDIPSTSGAASYTTLFDFTESYCLDCDTSYYNPSLVYTISDSGIRIDSVKSKEETVKRYGSFHGFEYCDSILLKVFPD